MLPNTKYKFAHNMLRGNISVR